MATNDTPVWGSLQKNLIDTNHLTGLTAPQKPDEAKGEKKKTESAWADTYLTRIQRIRRDVPTTNTDITIQDCSVFGKYSKWYDGKPMTSWTRAHALNPAGLHAPWPRRKPITTVVVHGTAGGTTLEDLEKWVYGAPIPTGPTYNMMVPSNYGVTFHYAIDNTGKIGQFVPDDYWNYHSTCADADEETIGIELVMPSNSYHAPTQKQFDALIRLIVHLREKHSTIQYVDSHSWREWYYTCIYVPTQSNKDCPGMPFVNAYMNYGIVGGWQYSKFYQLLHLFDLESTAVFDLQSYRRPGEDYDDPEGIGTIEVWTGYRSRFRLTLTPGPQWGQR